MNHIWSFAGNDDRVSVNSTFLQPFLSYSTKTFTSFQVNTESTYNWQADNWTVPLNFNISQLLKIDKQLITLQFGPRVYVERPDGGPNWGLRFTVTLLYPTK